MSPETLAMFRSMGKLLEPKYDMLAIEHQKMTDTLEQEKKKILSIEYVSAENNELDLILNFSLKLANIKSLQFIIVINSIAKDDVFSLSRNVKFSKGNKQTYQMKIPHDTFKINNITISFEASITADGITTKSNKFDLHFCNCYRKFTEEEFKQLVIDIRKTNNYKKYAEVLFDKEYIEKIPKPNWKSFTDEINSTFEKFKITKCIHKIHFIAQTFHESALYRATYEGLKEVPENYKGGVAFQGRGIKQITHDYNYLEYYDYIKNTTFYKNYYQIIKKDTDGNVIESIENCIKRTDNKDKIINNAFLSVLKEFAKRLSTEIHFACDSAGWYWNKHKLNDFTTDKENAVILVSAKVNNPKASSNTSGKGINGLTERKKYTSDLKKHLNYEKCNNK